MLLLGSQADAQAVLDTMQVRAVRVPVYLTEFERRRRSGVGHYLTGAQLDSARHEFIADLAAQRFTGIRAQWSVKGADVTLISTRGVLSFHEPLCSVHVYIDDMFARPEDLGSLKSGDIAGVEYYSDIPPVRYKRAGSQCGVVLIWTRKW